MLLFCLLNNSCAQNSTISNYTNEQYQKYKDYFDAKIVDHFPVEILTAVGRSAVFSTTDKKKNDYGLTLYEYGVLPTEIDIVRKKFQKIAVAKYSSLDSCLLIVNRFETKESHDSLEIPNIGNINLVNRTCYEDKYPIPNFVNYVNYKKDRALRLDSTFTIYVIESKIENSQIAEFDMGPAPQMPDSWKSGYSKGVAISLKDQTIIYWVVIW